MITASIIIPIYNTGERLIRCLESVRKQTFINFECLMIDDGSEDDSPIVIDRYAQKDIRFKAIHKINGGVSSARNYGLQNAKGEWVVFVDSDDFLMPNHLEAMLAVVDDGIDLVFTGYDQISANKKIVRGHQYNNEVYAGLRAIETFFSQTDALQYMIPWDRMYRRSVIESYLIRFDERLSLSEDRLFGYYFFLHTKGLKTISEVTYRHDASDVNSLSFRSYPFLVNAYRYGAFVDVVEKLMARYSLSAHVLFLLWKYVWDILVLTLSSMYDLKKNIFVVSNKQKVFFENYFCWKLYDAIKDTPEFYSFATSVEFRVIIQKQFLKWNFHKALKYVLYKLHILR